MPWRKDGDSKAERIYATAMSIIETDTKRTRAKTERLRALRPAPRHLKKKSYRPHRAMTDSDCSLCRGERWVCEEHPGQPWGHVGCKGAGRAERATSTSESIQNRR
jgi:hypothetical protein